MSALPKMTHAPAAVKSISFPWSESKHIDEKLTFGSYEAASKHISEAAQHRPKGGGYHKTEFKVTFEDGQDYIGRVEFDRVDITREMVAGYNLLDHMRLFTSFYAGRFTPPHMTVQDHQGVLRCHSEEHRQGMSDFLDKYLGGMEPQDIDEAAHNAEAERLRREQMERLADDMRRNMPADAPNCD